jgi:hypothetical protein
VKIDSLLICTVTVLELLIDQYNTGKIKKDVFKKNTSLKVSFLKENISMIRLSNQRCYAEKILTKCNDILNKENPYLLK